MNSRQIEEIYKNYASEFSGVCLVIKGNETLFAVANGLANRDFNIPNTINTRFDTASVTKIFTAAAVLQLAEKGLLGLDDKIHDIVDLKNTAIPDDVRIEHLLNHTSGIADDADEEAGEDYSTLFIDKPNYAIRNCADFLPNFAHKPHNFKAGTNVRYNNCAYILLGLAIEKITGIDCRHYITKNIFLAAEMDNSYFGSKDEVCPDTAEGYFTLKDKIGNFIKWKKNIYSYPPSGTPDGGAFTTAGDLDIFIRSFKNGKLLSAKYSELFFQPHCDIARQTKYGTWRTGYGFEFLETEGKIFCIYKEGGNPGVDAICAYYPVMDIGLYILANQDGPLWKMYGEFRELLYEDFIFCLKGKEY